MAGVERILVNSRELRGIAGKLDHIVSSIERIESVMERLETEADDSWKGTAPEEAVKDFSKVKERMVSLKEQLLQRARSIQAVCEAYEETEDKSVSNVSALSVQNIFG